MKIKKSFETETYTTESGYYAIRQECEFENIVTLLTPEQMRMLIVDMEHHLKDLSWREV